MDTEVCNQAVEGDLTAAAVVVSVSGYLADQWVDHFRAEELVVVVHLMALASDCLLWALFETFVVGQEEAADGENRAYWMDTVVAAVD